MNLNWYSFFNFYIRLHLKALNFAARSRFRGHDRPIQLESLHTKCILLVLSSRISTHSKKWFTFFFFFVLKIFTSLLRGFGLPFSTKDSILLGIGNSTSSGSVNNNMSQVFVYSNENINSMAVLIVNMIGSGNGSDDNDDKLSEFDPNSERNLCMNHIRRLFELLRSFFYPSNTGSWSVSWFNKNILILIKKSLSLNFF